MSELTEKQLEHLHQLVEGFHQIMEPKYTRGALEHGGNIWDLSDDELEAMELEEIIDLCVYRLTRLLKKRGQRGL